MTTQTTAAAVALTQVDAGADWTEVTPPSREELRQIAREAEDAERRRFHEAALAEFEPDREAFVARASAKSVVHRVNVGVAHALSLLGHRAEAVGSAHMHWLENVPKFSSRLVVDDEPARDYEVREERTSVSSWRSKPNGKLRVVVGDHGDKTSFPQRADGTHNYQGIAAALDRVIRARRAREAAQAAHVSNAAVVDGLNAELGLPKWAGPLTATQDKSKPVKLALTAHLSVEDARRAVAALRELGLVARPTQG